ncbi:integrase [Gossypium australe]|uniref:Integrase n=1 Tax=Gossypium australe TaxID=47621 RepID=A0A5B6WUA5_9ROSI|nr:integrase [Gossypium australe]
MFRGRIFVPKNSELIQKILHEAHNGCLSIHPGSTKMYNDMKQLYWWLGMKQHILEFVSRCLICQQVKAKHQVPSGLLQPVMIPEWKWNRVTMDFVSVVVDRLTKSAHFIPVRTDYSLDKLVELDISEIRLQEALGMRLNFSTTCHQQTDGQSERNLKIIGRNIYHWLNSRIITAFNRA